eukprot:CAMPEP_0201092462 /NCGR_PEP_ID=MMETSP0812-20130820/1060_1 /ASSEMBLY_ACC=CAM_ASM_000668 /TAXON_ID=98059 /ORGANISM="Dinobryon sp., Strain UTEXLB2267" /LENGTH=68 /DNA_ID=CAMNT_0047344091 /DNA_START=163 /DNA_END=365 /DNA_ORIENTATION=+
MPKTAFVPAVADDGDHLYQHDHGVGDAVRGAVTQHEGQHRQVEAQDRGRTSSATSEPAAVPVQSSSQT